jgi:predicted nucleic acid-binding protein
VQIVIDASAIIAILFNEPSKTAIIEKTKSVDLVSPLSLTWEVGNAISASIKRGRITPEQGIQAIRQYNSIEIRLVDVDLEEAIIISSRLKLYAYDAYLLCCASNLKLPLLCLDKRMAQTAREIGIRTIEV